MSENQNKLRIFLDLAWEYIITTPVDFLKEKLDFIVTIPLNLLKKFFIPPKKYLQQNDHTVLLFLEESWFRSLSKTVSIKFWAYFITGIVIFGGSGVWLEVGKIILDHSNGRNISINNLNQALLFYITTLLGGICSQVFLDDLIPKHIKSGAWILIIFTYFCTAAVAYVQSQPNDELILCFSLILTTLSLSIAWLINTFNPSVNEEKIDNSTGGEIHLGEAVGRDTKQDPLKSNFGNLKEF